MDKVLACHAISAFRVAFRVPEEFMLRKSSLAADGKLPARYDHNHDNDNDADCSIYRPGISF